MPTPHRSDTRPAEQVLEDLLKAWPPSAETRAKSPVKRRPFATAFLPPASHQPPRLPVFRLQTPPMARVDLRPLPGRAEAEPKRGPSRIVTPSFQAVADAIATREAGSSARVRTKADADEPSASPDSGEDYRFAAQVVALKAAGALDPPAASGGGSPAPSGHAEPYGEDATAATTHDASADHLSALSAIVDLDPRLGHLERSYPPDGGPRSPFSDDDVATPLPRSIFL